MLPFSSFAFEDLVLLTLRIPQQFVGGLASLFKRHKIFRFTELISSLKDKAVNFIHFEVLFAELCLSFAGFGDKSLLSQLTIDY